MFRIAVFVSGGGTNLQAIIDHIGDGRLQGVEIVRVISSRNDAYATIRADKAGIPCEVIRRADYPNIDSYDQAILASLAGRDIHLIILAGFMNLLGPRFVQAYQHRIINIHPSLIPAFSGPGLYGLKPHEAALAYGVKVSGATVHYVDENYDEGPILLQKAIPVWDDDTPQTLQQRIMQEAEQELLPQAIALIATGRVRVDGRRTIIREEE
jgi:phosphoribosylglycinamide formyltransferase-1